MMGRLAELNRMHCIILLPSTSIHFVSTVGCESLLRGHLTLNHFWHPPRGFTSRPHHSTNYEENNAQVYNRSSEQQ